LWRNERGRPAGGHATFRQRDAEALLPALRGYATATDLADYLVKKGLSFRDAHEVVAPAVKLALQQGVGLAQLPLART
jgi:argininosuccinate lyase